MQLIPITDINIPELSIYSELRENAFRSDGSFIADSPKVVNLLLENAKLEVKSILATHEYYDAFEEVLRKAYVRECYVTTKEQMGRIVGHKIHHNCMMHALRPKDVSLDDLGERVLMLDGITSAENVGSIVRSAAALGVDSLVIAKETPHPYNRRALRVSMGYAHMLQTHMHEDIKKSIVALQSRGYRVYAAEVAEGATMLSELKPAHKWALVMGHEGRGISEDILLLCDEVLTIEMQEGVKSLNVAVAASLLMYKLLH